MLGFGSGGRRRSEITNPYREDIGTEDFAAKGLLWVRLMETGTTGKSEVPHLPLKGRAARAVIGWIEATGIDADGKGGLLFRPVSEADRAPPRKLAPDAIQMILRHRLKLAGLPQDYATPHGLRGRVPDASRAGRRAAGGGDEAIAASIRDPGAEIRCRCRDHREPCNGFAGVILAKPLTTRDKTAARPRR